MDLRSISQHFEFGDNWKSYVALVDEERIAEAVNGLKKLVSEEHIRGKVFFDIGCGSGLSMLAALRLGASAVIGVDIDERCVDASRLLLSKFAPSDRWQVREQSIFELNPDLVGQFDIVHSWGVLHHTGDMWSALSIAASLVNKGGLLLIALYHKTPLCSFWRAEKRFYAHGSKLRQKLIGIIYKTGHTAMVVLTGGNPWRFWREYKIHRGMDWAHDVHDWLGGYPYESALPSEVSQYLSARGLRIEKLLVNFRGRIGLFGTACDEFVACRI